MTSPSPLTQAQWLGSNGISREGGVLARSSLPDPCPCPFPFFLVMNLLTLAKSRFTLETLTDLSDLLGIEAEAVPGLLDQALPTILAIFQAAAADPAKAPILDQLIADADACLLEDPAAALSQHGPELLRSGKSTLARLLGPQLTDYIAPLAKATHLGEGKIASALGSLTPFLTSLLTRHASNASELHTLLSEQELAAPAPDPKATPKQAAPAKSYLPDPNKKAERRPRNKRKMALVGLVITLLCGGGGYYLTETQPEWLREVPLLQNLLDEPTPDDPDPRE